MKYLIFDLDDTLINDNLKLSNFTIEVLKKCQNNNFKIVFNTARTMEFCKRYKNDLNVDYYITDGGAVIYDENFNLLCQRTIDPNKLQLLLTRLINDKVIEDITVQTKEGLYSEDLHYVSNHPFAKYKKLLDIDTPATKVLIKSSNINYLNKIKDEFDLILTNYRGGIWNRYSASNKYLGNILLKDYLNDSNFYDICFGDDVGDIEMLINAKHAVCMKNSQSPVLDKIKNVTKDDSNHDGCAKYILENILNGIDL